MLAGCATAPQHDFASTAELIQTEFNRTGTVPRLTTPATHVTDLGPLLARAVAGTKVPAVAAAVLRGDQIIAEGVAGIRRAGTPERVTINDTWEIASCAKAMTATAIGRLVEDGTLSWDEPVAHAFPDEAVDPAWEHITLRHLLTHTAGISDPIATFFANTYFTRGSLTERRAAYVRQVLRHAPAHAAGTHVGYANTDYILAAVIAERRTHLPWEQLMARTVFAPLGLLSAGFGPPGEPGSVAQPWGHGKHRVLQVGLFGSAAFDPGSSTADYPAMASPAGYVHLSLRDWEQFVALHLRGDAANPHRVCRVLRAETFDQLHALRPGVDYAGGWVVGTRPWAKGPRPGDIGRVLYHFGNNGRWTSAAWMDPEIDLAVLVTCNAGDQERVIDRVLGELVHRFAQNSR